MHSLSFENYKIIYTIEDDLNVSIHTDLLMYGKKLTHLPIKVNSVNGNMDVSNNHLFMLNGCSDYIPRAFIARNNKLTDLSGGFKSNR